MQMHRPRHQVLEEFTTAAVNARCFKRSMSIFIDIPYVHVHVVQQKLSSKLFKLPIDEAAQRPTPFICFAQYCSVRYVMEY